MCSTCSSSSLSRRSWDSSCLLWSSRICIRVSRRVLCCRRTRASARSSSSCCPSAVGEPGPPSPASVSMGTDAASACFHLSLLYSPWSTLRTHGGQTEGQKWGPHAGVHVYPAFSYIILKLFHPMYKNKHMQAYQQGANVLLCSHVESNHFHCEFKAQ